MDPPHKTEIAHEFLPLFRVYKNGRVEKLQRATFVPSSGNPGTTVRSKDVVISRDPTVPARLFLPKITTPNHKLPILIYIHGGAFTTGSAFSRPYHNYVTSLVAESNVVAVSIEYRLFPEHPIPACYDDVWTTLKWVDSHASNQGPDPWINDHADFRRVFLVGDSAGANIAHNMAVRAGADGLLKELSITGMVLIHPFFGSDEPCKLWCFVCPGCDPIGDPRLNPARHPDLLAKLGCKRVMMLVATKDNLRGRGWSYYEGLRKSGWGGVVKIIETEDEDHVFHLVKPDCEKARVMMKRVASFINHQNIPSKL